MGAEPIRQGRGLFGRRREELDAGPSEMEVRLQAAEGRAEAAETRVGDLQQELMFYGDAIRSLKSELEAVTERVVSRVAPQVVELEARNAETEALRQSVVALESDARAERDQLMSWRERMEHAVDALRVDIDNARSHIDRMPERIREALTPAAEAMATVGAGMARLAEISVPTTILEPGEGTTGGESGDEPAPGDWRPEADDDGIMGGSSFNGEGDYDHEVTGSISPGRWEG